MQGVAAEMMTTCHGRLASQPLGGTIRSQATRFAHVGGDGLKVVFRERQGQVLQN